ncbi:MAG: DNA-methyltransferase [Acidimicrobiales bacterium]
MRRPTSTSAFGVGKRESHDASGFYERFTPPVLSDDTEVAHRRAVDKLICGDSRSMDEVPDRSVALVVTSPPYFAGKEYETALGEGHVPATYIDYLRMLEEVFAECVRKLEPGGRIAVNVANLGRRPYRSLSADITAILQDKLRLLLRGEILWLKARGAGGNCAWGSFQSPHNPVLRDLTERIVVASKGRFDRAVTAKERAARDLPHQPSLTRDHFMALTTDVWEFGPERATKVGHPAPFPVELPERLIHLYTYRADLVLDPFLGVGTTAVAAVRTGRHYAGYDTDPAYVEKAETRVSAAAGASAAAGERLPTTAAKDVAQQLLVECGFSDVKPGTDVTFHATDAHGRAWRFELCGAFSSAKPGLGRRDNLYKAIGKAAALSARDPKVPVVLLTVDAPASADAIRAVSGPDRPVHAVVNVLDAADRARLTAISNVLMVR